MKPSLAAGALLATALAVTPSLMAVVNAQATATASIALAAGEEKEVCSGVNAAVTPATPKFGDLRTDPTPPTPDKPVKILYKAKPTTAAVAEDLTCTSGTDKKPVKVSITPKPADPTQTTDAGPRNVISGFGELTYGDAFKALFLLFVLATVLESALAILFNW